LGELLAVCEKELARESAKDIAGGEDVPEGGAVNDDEEDPEGEIVNGDEEDS
jgi:hypothetical protein